MAYWALVGYMMLVVFLWLVFPLVAIGFSLIMLGVLTYANYKW